MSRTSLSSLLPRVVLGLGGVATSSRKISPGVRVGIARVEYANGFFVLGPILSLYLIISEFYAGSWIFYSLLAIGAFIYWRSIRSLKEVGKDAIRYHYRNHAHAHEFGQRSLRSLGWAYFVGSGVFCWLLIMLTAFGLFLLTSNQS